MARKRIASSPPSSPPPATKPRTRAAATASSSRTKGSKKQLATPNQTRDGDWRDDGEDTNDKDGEIEVVDVDAISEAEAPRPAADPKGKNTKRPKAPKPVPVGKTRKLLPTTLHKPAFRDIDTLSDTFTNKISKLFKLGIIHARSKEKARVARHMAHAARESLIKTSMAYEKGLSPANRDRYHQRQVLDAQTRLKTQDTTIARIQRDNTELQYKNLKLEKELRETKKELEEIKEQGENRDMLASLEQADALVRGTTF